MTDAALVDASSKDSGAADAWVPDASIADAAISDASTTDSSPLDAAVIPDASSTDGAKLDAAVTDATIKDAAFADAAIRDAAKLDSAIIDAAIPDAAGADSAIIDASIPDASTADSAITDSGAPHEDAGVVFTSEIVMDPFVASYAPPSTAEIAWRTPMHITFMPSALPTDFIKPDTVVVRVNGTVVTAAEYRTRTSGNREFVFLPFPYWHPGQVYTIEIASGVAYQMDTTRTLSTSVHWNFHVAPDVIQQSFDPLTTPALTAAELAIIDPGASANFSSNDVLHDYTDPLSTLHDLSWPVDPSSPDITSFAARLVSSASSMGANGLAATQVGVNRRLFSARIGSNVEAFINPVVIQWANELYFGSKEGCLSVSGVSAKIGRPAWVRIHYNNADGELVSDRLLQNDDAKVFLHEFDHLNGILIVDRQQER